MCLKMSESEIRRAVALYENGVTPEAIGGELGYSPRTVRLHLTEAGIIADRKGAGAAADDNDFDPGKIRSKIALMRREPVRRRRNRAQCEAAIRRNIGEIIMANAAGYSLKRIAAAVGVNADDLKDVLADAGFKGFRSARGHHRTRQPARAAA